METINLDHSFGNQLKQKREERLLTIEDIANYLRLKKNLIEDIENDNYGKIPFVYLKGYLRSYAKLLAIPESEQIFKSLEIIISEKTTGVGKSLDYRKEISSSNGFIQWVTYGIISILIILVTLWWKN